jgi:hypothetical protein
MGLKMKIAKRCVACDSDRLNHVPAVLAPFVAFRVFGWLPTHIAPEWGLRDIPTGVAYSVCKSMMCKDCGMLFLDVRFDDEEMAALYADYRGEGYVTTRDRFEPGYRARNTLLANRNCDIAQIEAFIGPHLDTRPRILDWGGGTGINTPFRFHAAQHDIYDISNRPVVDGAHVVDAETAKRNAYDLIVFSNVLEHVSYPQDVLRELVCMMRSEALLYVEIPYEDVVREIDDPMLRLLRKRHWHEHINFFTPEALDVIFREVGLRVVDRKSHLMNAGGKEGYVFSILATRLS